MFTWINISFMWSFQISVIKQRSDGKNEIYLYPLNYATRNWLWLISIIELQPSSRGLGAVLQFVLFTNVCKLFTRQDTWLPMEKNAWRLVSFTSQPISKRDWSTEIVGQTLEWISTKINPLSRSRLCYEHFDTLLRLYYLLYIRINLRIF